VSNRRDGLRPGEVAHAKRVAKVIGQHVQPKTPRAIRNVIVRLKAHQLRLRDLDTPNGHDALVAIIETMTRKELNEATPALGKLWELTASRAIQCMGTDRLRPLPAPLNIQIARYQR